MQIGNNDQGEPIADFGADTAQAQTGQIVETVFDVSTADFEDKVMRASLQVPVLVDFWAPWCGPCKQLMPVLEKVVKEAGGEVLLAKVNLDENQQLAGMLRVQSVPTVFAFFQGQPVDAFQGNMPESQIREFVSALVKMARGSRPDALDVPVTLKQAADALGADDIATAQDLYIQVLEQDPENVQAYVGLIRCFVASGDIAEAEAAIENAPEPIAKDRNFAEAKSAVELAKTAPASPIDELLAKVEADEKDHASRIDLALALFSQGKREDATEQLLKSIEIDRNWNDEAARKELLKLFEAMGHADPVSSAARRKLSSILFS